MKQNERLTLSTKEPAKVIRGNNQGGSVLAWGYARGSFLLVLMWPSNEQTEALFSIDANILLALYITSS